jgi:hypothetical protein
MNKKNIDLGISLTCFKRADYLKQVLDSLKESLNYYGDHSFVLYPNIDYHNKEVVELVEKINWIETKITCNNPPIGCNRNTKEAIKKVSENHETILHLEDDTVLTYDAIDFYVYMLIKYANSNSVISISGYNKTEELDKNSYFSTFEEKFFCCWGCAFWQNKIKIILDNWTSQLGFMNPQSWDSFLQENVFKNKYFQARPIVSRIQNIGAKNGTYVHDPVWHYYNHRSPFTSNDLRLNSYPTWKQYAENN